MNLTQLKHVVELFWNDRLKPIQAKDELIDLPKEQQNFLRNKGLPKSEEIIYISTWNLIFKFDSLQPTHQNNLQIGKFHDPYMDTTYDGLLLLNPTNGLITSYWKISARTQFINSNIIQMLYFLSVYEQYKPKIDELGKILGDLKTHLPHEERIEINKKTTKMMQELMSEIESIFRQADPNVFLYEDGFWQLWLTD